ncbi:MAG: GTP cyclohydrolase I, partial [Elusimicrobiaceae bacterium]|nr:GTP cyclohydrolase I [Elusimicrobiaceae bacterium]
MLAYIGDDPAREGLLETPKRIVKSWKKLYGGYAQKPQDVLKTFVEGSCEEMVVLKDIEFYSTCEHHLQPFFG